MLCSHIVAGWSPQLSIVWVCVCLQLLLTAQWPKRLEQHPHTCIRLQQLSDMKGTSALMIQEHDHVQ